MAETDERELLESNITSADLTRLYAAQRLAEMGGIDAWFYRRFLALPARVRLFVARAGICLLIWLSIEGAFALVSGHERGNYLTLIGLMIGCGIAASMRPVSFPYR